MNEKLTAYALNELPPDERAELEAQLQRDPALAAQAAELEEFCHMLGEHIAPVSETLTNEQRLTLIKTFKATPAKPKAVSHWRKLLVLSTTALAACLAVMLVKNQDLQPATSADLIADTGRTTPRSQASERVTVTAGKPDAFGKAAPVPESPVIKKEAPPLPVLATAKPKPEMKNMKELRTDDTSRFKDLNQPAPKIVSAPPAPMAPAAASPAAPTDPADPAPVPALAASPTPIKQPTSGGKNAPALTMGTAIIRQEAFKSPLSEDDASRLGLHDRPVSANAAAPPLAAINPTVADNIDRDGTLTIKGGTGDVILSASNPAPSVKLDLGNIGAATYTSPLRPPGAAPLPWAIGDLTATDLAGARATGIIGGWASTTPDFSTKAGTLDVNGMIADNGRADSSSTVPFSSVIPKPSKELHSSANPAGGSFAFGDTNDYIGSTPTNGGFMSSGSSSVPSPGPNADLSVTGGIAGGGGIVKSGSGTLTLDGSNSYTGGTIVSAGVLSTGQDSGAMGPASVTNSLSLSPDSSTITALTTDSSKSLSRSAGSEVRFSSSSTTGGITVNGGTLQMGTGGSGTSAPNVTTAATTASGSISAVGANTLTKDGGGTLTLNGSSSVDKAMPATPAPEVTSGATLTLGGSVVVNSGGITNAGSNEEAKRETTTTRGGKLVGAVPQAAAKAKSAAAVAPSSIDGYIADNSSTPRARMLNAVSDKWEEKPSAVPAPVTVMNAGGGAVVLKDGQELKTFGPTRLEIAQEKAAQPAPGLSIADEKTVGEERLRRLSELQKQRLDALAPTTPAPAPTGTQTYRPIIENPFTYVAQEPLSTFSTDVDTASYANVRRFLNHGQRPPADAVRLEELINYFPYTYEPPADDKPFAVHVDLAEAPWQPLHRLARIGLKAREIHDERRAANFVFLLDVSGSMSPPERLPLIKQGLRLLVEQLREDDHVAIVTYAGESGVALESTSAAEKERIMQVIDKLKAGGSTNGASGIRLAYEQAARNFHKDHINRVILATDGDFNVGASSVNELEALIAEKAKGGVFLSVLGVGTDNLKDHTMQTLADRGNGNYHYLDSLSEARKVLVDQMTGTLVTIAKDVKIQVEFNPAQVAAYRLIGYEKRMLAKQDFNDDKKDAGEIGAGHTITALYEIVPASLKYPDGKPLVDDLKYAPKPAAPAAEPSIQHPASSNELMTVKLRYKAPDGDKSQLMEQPVTDAGKKLSEAPKDFQFAVSAAGFGMLLRDSQQRGELNWELVRSLAQKGKGDDPNGYRGEFLQLIDKARSVCEPH